MSDQSRVFIGLLRPPKLMGLPIMYAMVWLFGSGDSQREKLSGAGRCRRLRLCGALL